MRERGGRRWKREEKGGGERKGGKREGGRRIGTWDSSRPC